MFKIAMFGLVLSLGLAGCGGPKPDCSGSAYPELCGSAICEQVAVCCDSDAGSALAGSCDEVNTRLADVPDFAKQVVRDEVCKQFLKQAQSDGQCAN